MRVGDIGVAECLLMHQQQRRHVEQARIAPHRFRDGHGRFAAVQRVHHDRVEGAFVQIVEGGEGRESRDDVDILFLKRIDDRHVGRVGAADEQNAHGASGCVDGQGEVLAEGFAHRVAAAQDLRFHLAQTDERGRAQSNLNRMDGIVENRVERMIARNFARQSAQHGQVARGETRPDPGDDVCGVFNIVGQETEHGGGRSDREVECATAVIAGEGHIQGQVAQMLDQLHRPAHIVRDDENAPVDPRRGGRGIRRLRHVRAVTTRTLRFR